MRFASSLCGIMLVAFGFANHLLADDLLVPNQYATIEIAIAAASDGDVIVVDNHPETLPHGWADGFRDLDFSPNDGPTKFITIRSANGPDNCFIDLTGGHDAFIFDSHEDQRAVVQGFTFFVLDGDTNFAASAAIQCMASSPRIVNCRFVNRVVQT
ncbi:MAG: hypothetical protein JNG88_16880, partial [Phycisphaerales bacterium]|nr:hypothetical protein [Phycisphaerales bacterium]